MTGDQEYANVVGANAGLVGPRCAKDLTQLRSGLGPERRVGEDVVDEEDLERSTDQEYGLERFKQSVDARVGRVLHANVQECEEPNEEVEKFAEVNHLVASGSGGQVNNAQSSEARRGGGS